MIRKKAFFIFFLLIIFQLFVFTGVCLADYAEEVEVQRIYVNSDPVESTFTVWRSKSTKTDDFIYAGEIPFSYSIICADENGKTLKTTKGSGSLPAGKEEVIIDVQKITAEMDNLLEKHSHITIAFKITKIDDSFDVSNTDMVITGEKAIRDSLAQAGYSKAEIDEQVKLYKAGKAIMKGEGYEGDLYVPSESGNGTDDIGKAEDATGKVNAAKTQRKDAAAISGKPADGQERAALSDVFGKVKAILYFIGIADIVVVVAAIVIIVLRRKK